MSVGVTAGFVDLATFDEIEKYQYGGSDAFAYFVRDTNKSTWFTQIPVTLNTTGNANFGGSITATVSRAADYLLSVWLRLTLPSVTLEAQNLFTTNGRISWTRNLMHNLIREASIRFNDLVAEQFDNYFLDFWAAFTTDASKQFGYNNMIGQRGDLVDPNASGTALPSLNLNLPLPFFFTRDSGVALPTAALPYNTITINLSFRRWQDLLILSNGVGGLSAANNFTVPRVPQDIATAPELSDVQVWANYAIVSSEERKRMACAPRDILIEQVQSANSNMVFTPATNANPRYDLRFSNSVKVLFFAVQNTTFPNIWSQYQTNSPVPSTGAVINFQPDSSVDPILTTSLVYENTNRLFQMGSDYYSLVNPWYHAPTIPSEIGYHMYSYSLFFFNLDPMGSTNYGKLSNVTLALAASQQAITAANGTGGAQTGSNYAQSYQFVCVAVNNNIIRISGGALGFPVL